MMANLTVQEIVKQYLKDHKYDGLFHADGNCACSVDNDLMDCCEPCQDCEAGYKNPCNCGEHDYHITRDKHPIDDFCD